MEFFIQDGDETRLKNARLADDMDLLYSKHHVGHWGPELVACAMRAGAQVCWYCQELFDETRSAFRQTEVRHGYTLILLHAGCVGKKPRTAQVFHDLVRGHQLRREMTRVAKASSVLEELCDDPLDLDTALFAKAREAIPITGMLDEPFAREEMLIEAPSGLDALQPRPSDDGDKLSS